MTTYDAIIIGGGHNGLVAACYLAKAGKRVLVLERYHTVGGAAITEEIHPGFRVSVASYSMSLMRPEIIEELRLADYGFSVYAKKPSFFIARSPMAATCCCMPATASRARRRSPSSRPRTPPPTMPGRISGIAAATSSSRP